MIIEIAVASIALILFAGLICLIAFLRKTLQAIESAKRDIHHVSGEGVELMRKAEALVTDIQSKSESLDVVFRPLKAIGKAKRHSEASDTAAEIVDWATASLALFNKIRNALRRK